MYFSVYDQSSVEKHRFSFTEVKQPQIWQLPEVLMSFYPTYQPTVYFSKKKQRLRIDCMLFLISITGFETLFSAYAVLLIAHLRIIKSDWIREFTPYVVQKNQDFKSEELIENRKKIPASTRGNHQTPTKLYHNPAIEKQILVVQTGILFSIPNHTYSIYMD